MTNNYLELNIGFWIINCLITEVPVFMINYFKYK